MTEEHEHAYQRIGIHSGERDGRDAARHPFAGRSGSMVAAGLVAMFDVDPDLAWRTAMHLMGVPTKTQNHDCKTFSQHETVRVDEDTRTVPFESNETT